jgi:hypothetical protein
MTTQLAAINAGKMKNHFIWGSMACLRCRS